MPVIAITQSIAAGAVNVNILSGSTYEFAQRPQVVSLGVAQSATGMFCSINSGSDIIAEEFEPPILTRYPIIPDEMYFTDVMDVGDRLVIRMRNPTAGALIARAMVQTQAL